MDSQILNTKRDSLYAAQEAILNKAQELKRGLNTEEDAQFKNLEAEITSVEQTIARMDAVNKGRAAIAAPTTDAFVPEVKLSKSGKQTFSKEYEEAFWNRFKTRQFNNTTNLNEGNNANGDYLVPVRVDGEIVALAPLESAMRKLALVIPTTMDIKLPAQLTKTVASAKSESSTVTDQAFTASNPTFTQVTLASHMAGTYVPVSFELAQDVPALQAFLNADILRGIQNWEESKFINGSGSGEPMGILNGATAFETAALSIDSILDLEASLPAAYYANASFLMHRKTGVTLKKAQLAANQFQNFWSTNPDGTSVLDGYPVVYSSQMPVYVASPAVTGAVAFGDFKTCAAIGDRGGSNVSIKVLDQINALNGVIQVLGYRRTDQRVRVAEAVQILTING
jgi:HK97 family phage major capsid protein